MLLFQAFHSCMMAEHLSEPVPAATLLCCCLPTGAQSRADAAHTHKLLLYTYFSCFCTLSHALPALAGELGPFAMAEIGLRLLHSLVRLQPAQGEGGRTLYPLPLVHRQIAGPTCLPHLAQVGPAPSCPVSCVCMQHAGHCSQASAVI